MGREETPTDELIARVHEEMRAVEVDSEKYLELLGRLERLHKMKVENSLHA